MAEALEIMGMLRVLDPENNQTQQWGPFFGRDLVA